MAQLPLDRPAGVLVKTTCVDFPGLLAGSFFLRGCNLRCPYCYNTELVTGPVESKLDTIQDLFNHLEKRQGILSGLVISGGEPLLSPYTPLIIQKAKELGYKVKLDTNGLLPEKLEELINDKALCPDFIAMDIKTSFNKYSTEICGENSIFYKNEEFFKDTLLKSVNLLKNFPPEQREFRTVLVPELIGEKEIIEIGTILPKDSDWKFAQFRNQNCLNPAYNEMYPYTDKEAEKLIDLAKQYIPKTELR